MKKLLSMLAIACLCCQFAIYAQQPCGFDHLHKKLLNEDPAYARTIAQNDESIKRYIAAHPETRNRSTNRLLAPLYTIPVVVHVVHTGGAIGSIYNPTDAQIIGAINYLNQVYDGTLPGTEGIGEIQIQFAMAQRDPNCNPTNGIDRVNGSGLTGYVANGVNVLNIGGATELSVKNLSRWNTANYYNIWVVNKLDGADGTAGQFIAGFAYFPGSSATLDGTVMLATTMTANNKTLPHEIGHAFNLYHPFEGSLDASMCPANTTCGTQGDRICDTDPISFNQTAGVVNFTPRTGSTNTCTGTLYTISTEKNYMNYTNSFTLFTADQKARMLASMALPSRAGLATSPGATPTHLTPACAPKINFELSADAATESTVSTSGCRSYRDYTFNMVIGADPSAAATATLAISAGTATEGVDFDITTNGNFAAPSKVVNFPSGSHALRPFTIRIYDDAIIDGTETFTLDYTVNNGVGNAVLGDGKPTLTITINDNDVAPVVPGAPGTGTIGATTYTAVPTTFDARLLSQRTQVVYRASELTAAGIVPGDLTGLSVNLQKFSTRAFSNLTIKVGHTALNPLVETATSTYQVIVTPMTTVKTLASYATVNGWNDFTFDVPFTWNGTSNIAIEICFDNGTAAAGDAGDRVVLYTDGGTATQGNMVYQPNINCSQNFPSLNYFPNGIKPMIRIAYGNPGNPVATTTITSLSQHLGPNADVYFYSNTGQIMARITNLSGFDYGCTQVSIDRTGTTSAQFWNNTTSNYLASKSFRVIPTNNTATGHYQIHLYYTQAEVNGWLGATGQSLAAAQVVKVSNGFYIPDVSPSTPHMADVSAVSASNTAFGSHYVISGDFNNTGFSGFGVGIPGSGTPLPITLVSFNGYKEGKAVKLNWKTASEYNNAKFDIETSKEDINRYYTIGTVNSRGNSITEQLYSFTDNVPAKGVNYYRLRQVDIDGRSTYSNTFSILFDEKGNPVIAYPNPAKENLTIELSKPAQNVTMQILTLDGKLMLQHSPGAVQRYETIDIHELSIGVYILQIKTETDIYNLKFVKN